MTREQTFDQLYSLKLPGLADALQRQLEDPEMDGLGFEVLPSARHGLGRR